MTTNLHLHRCLYILLATIMLAACSGGADKPEPLPTEISATDLDRRIAAGTEPFILDVRTHEEFVPAHVPGAVNINHTQFIEYADTALDQLPADTNAEIVVYCRSGKRAGMAIEEIRAAGYENVRHLTGDFQYWQSEGYRVEP